MGPAGGLEATRVLFQCASSSARKLAYLSFDQRALEVAQAAAPPRAPLAAEGGECAIQLGHKAKPFRFTLVCCVLCELCGSVLVLG
jgi:hypothetical protein